MQVEALQGFDHNGGSIKKGQIFEVSDVVAVELRRNRLVLPVGNPRKAAGVKSSASPVVQASPQTTAKPSRHGGKRKKADA